MKSLANFFTTQQAGRNTFDSIVKRVCYAEGMNSFGGKKCCTTHSLRGTSATTLFDSEHVESSILMPTGHHDFQSLKSHLRSARVGSGWG